jgi:hypothetical protein
MDSPRSPTSSASLSDPDRLFLDSVAPTTPPSSPPALAHKFGPSWPKSTLELAPLLQSFTVIPTTTEWGYDVDHPLCRILELNLANFVGTESLDAPNTYELLPARAKNYEQLEAVSNMLLYRGSVT